jgi:hypothetical protein
VWSRAAAPFLLKGLPTRSRQIAVFHLRGRQAFQSLQSQNILRPKGEFHTPKPSCRKAKNLFAERKKPLSEKSGAIFA